MKIFNNILAGLLGAFFVFSSAAFLFKLIPPEQMPKLQEGSLPWHFSKAVMETPYITLVKACELIGGILLAVPCTRNFGLLFLGPVLINILAYHQFVEKDGVFKPALIGIVAVTLYLLWIGRREFAGLIRRKRSSHAEPVS